MTDDTATLPAGPAHRASPSQEQDTDPSAPLGRGKAEPSSPPNTRPAGGTGWPVPGLALPPSTELLDRLRTGQGIAVAVVHLDAVIADAHGVGRHDPCVEDKGKACEPHVSTLETSRQAM